MCCHLTDALPTAAPHTRHMSSLGAYVRAPGAGHAGAPHPHECNYASFMATTDALHLCTH